MTVKSTVRSAVRSAIRGTVRSGGALLPEWTPIFEGLTTFAEYYANFTPTGSNSTLEIVFYKQGSKIQTIAFGDASAFSIALDASDVLTFNLISNVELNGVPATSGVTVVPDGYYVLTGDLDITSDIKYYAANATPANFFGIQIHSMKNTDNDDPSNSIDVNTVKRSKDAPSASDNLLINSLGSVGEELVVNGDFEDGTSNWLTNDSAVLSVSDKVLRVENGGSAASDGYQAVPVEIGKVYIVEAYLQDGDVTSRLLVGKDLTNNSYGIFDDGYTERTKVSGTFIAETAVAYVKVSPSSTTLGSYCYADNISVRETTRNIGQIKNLVGYELVNRGE